MNKLNYSFIYLPVMSLKTFITVYITNSFKVLCYLYALQLLAITSKCSVNSSYNSL